MKGKNEQLLFISYKMVVNVYFSVEYDDVKYN